MRKLLFILSLFVSLHSFSQVFIDGASGGGVSPSGNTYAGYYAKYLQGATKTVYDTTARNAIPSYLRDTSTFLVYTKADKNFWILSGGIANSNYVKVLISGSTNDSLLYKNNYWFGQNSYPNITLRDSYDTSTKVKFIYSNTAVCTTGNTGSLYFPNLSYCNVPSGSYAYDTVAYRSWTEQQITNNNDSLLNANNVWSGSNKYQVGTFSIQNYLDTSKYLAFLHADTSDNGSGRNGFALFPAVTPHGIGGNYDTVAYCSYVQSYVANNSYVLPKTVTLNTDTITLATFSSGSGASTDTSAFYPTALYGSFYNSGSDTLIITSLNIGLLGTSPSINVTIKYGAYLNYSGTEFVSGGTSCTNTTTGTIVNSLSVKIPPNNWVYCTNNSITTKPTYMSVSLIGYKKHK